MRRDFIDYLPVEHHLIAKVKSYDEVPVAADRQEHIESGSGHA